LIRIISTTRVTQIQVESPMSIRVSLKNGHEIVAYISFFDTTPLPDNSYTNNLINIHFPISRFNDVIGILRYEKPLRIQFDTSKLEGYIQTKEMELIGEQEGV
jgi:hypothetical protein